MTVLCATLLVVGCMVLAVMADDSNVTYSGNSGKLIFEPGSEYSPTDLFDNFKGVMPGASLTQKIEIRNNANDKVKVKVYLRSLGYTNQQYKDFLNQLKLTVREEGESPMFDAEADKTAGLTDWVCLGTLYSGGSVVLDVTLDVPTTLDNSFQNQIGKIKWQFVTEEFPVEEPKWTCPNNKGHSYHIEIRNGIAVFVCDVCDATEKMKCKTCGSDMQQVIAVTIGGKTYIAYYAGNNHYMTKDGRVHFYLNDDFIIEYYSIDGQIISIKNVDEYTLYTYYECINNQKHHTDPITPKTGDETHMGLWIGLVAVSMLLIVILLLVKRRKRNDEEERAKC